MPESTPLPHNICQHYMNLGCHFTRSSVTAEVPRDALCRTLKGTQCNWKWSESIDQLALPTSGLLRRFRPLRLSLSLWMPGLHVLVTFCTR